MTTAYTTVPQPSPGSVTPAVRDREVLRSNQRLRYPERTATRAATASPGLMPTAQASSQASAGMGWRTKTRRHDRRCCPITQRQATRLIVLRTTPDRARAPSWPWAGYGSGIALVGQDNLRRTFLQDVPDGANCVLIDMVACYASIADPRDHRQDPGWRPLPSHAGGPAPQPSRPFPPVDLDIPFAEPVRHKTQPRAAEFGLRTSCRYRREGCPGCWCLSRAC
jgi:hypothetical protein